jgi:hypothetical protein
VGDQGVVPKGITPWIRPIGHVGAETVCQIDHRYIAAKKAFESIRFLAAAHGHDERQLCETSM